MADKAEIANLQVVLSANTKALQDGLNRVAGAVDQMTAATQKGAERSGAALERMGKSANVAAGLIKGALAAFGSVQAVNVFGAALNQVIERGKLLEETRLGSTLTAGLIEAGRQAGVSSEEISGALNKFTEISKKAKEDADTFYKALGNIGPQFVKAFEAAPTQSERLRIVSDALKSTSDEVKRAQLSLEAFGVDSERMMRVLGGGREALQSYADAARATGVVIDEAMVEKAKNADRVLSDLSTVISANLRAAIVDLAPLIANMAASLGDLANMAGNAMAAMGGVRFNTTNNLRSSLDEKSKDLSLIRDNLDFVGPMTPDGAGQIRTNAALGAAMKAARERRNQEIVDIQTELARRGEYADPRERMAAASERFKLSGGMPNFNAFKGRPTLTGGGGRGGGGGGGGPSEAEQAADRLDKYVKSLERAKEVEQARLATFGQSNAAQKAAMEIARAMPDLNRVDAETKQRLTDAIRQQVTAIEESREAFARLKREQDSVREAAQGMAETMTSALEDMIFNGAKAQDVLKNLAKSVASASLKGLLTGEGMFGGLFGTKGVNGAPGGLLGGLFGNLFGGLLPFGGGKATGGPVNAGTAYLVGENRPEIFVPNTPGRIVPQVAQAGGGRTIVINQTIQANGDRSIMAAVRQAAESAVARSERGALGRMRLAEMRTG